LRNSGRALTLPTAKRLQKRAKGGFAESVRQWDNLRMRESIITAGLTSLAVAFAAPSLASAQAQQTPAAQQPATSGTATKPTTPKTTTQSGTAAKKPAAKTPAPLTLKTPKDKVSYAVGMSVGRRLKQDDLDVDPAIVLRAMKDALGGNKPLLTDADAQAAITAMQTEKRTALSAANKTAGEAFLAANKKKDGVVTTASGLQYKILKAGDGPKPTAKDTVVCNYRGTLLNDTEFDSSYKRGQPLTVPVTGVIKGWTEALQLMPVGSKWQLFIPGDLAYGERGARGTIGPNATLIFEVELLSIQPPNPPAPTPPPAPNTPAAPPTSTTPPPPTPKPNPSLL
jgi:FKBP-type peptidyl-prolyl cis-trans isomerase